MLYLSNDFRYNFLNLSFIAKLHSAFFEMFTELGITHMFDGTNRFKPNDTWGQPYKGERGKGSPLRTLNFYEGPRKVYFEAELFADILIAEYCLREIVQREQALKSKIMMTKKLGTCEDRHKGTEDQREAIKPLRRYSEAEYKLYVAEGKLPVGAIRISYDSLRQKRAWYLRQELVIDCARRGGCCSRNCGCCQTRHELAGRSKGLGHCTPSCGCCTNERGFEYSAAEIKSFVDDFRDQLYDDNPAYISHMAEVFFLLPSVDTEEKEPID
ncbi:unnamed protein product [Penicillium salamii]|uniref:Uncharacterized protein n=1 Tax=Penicillium salamii TaxID=1612424 RepID=A0A9W4J0J8_9EURO|nr:unnamed protein product [Penicillium salamii]CAG8178230.1 unnamed protein product [Penicillium salamii]CAG8262401.1 unnamed protein product [Penicillium salamii]CAG8362511.1 unnamed protein product [Penicillium salamii]CAG8366184.1 unnamed protein product [Penicillium salamii]